MLPRTLMTFQGINLITMVIGVAIGVSISFMNPAKENDNLWFVFFCGMVGVSGMTLPGLSGSFILILMGNYVLLLVDSVNELYKTIQDVFTWNFDFIYDEVRMRYMKIIASFGSGIHIWISDHCSNSGLFIKALASSHHGLDHWVYWGITRERMALEKGDLRNGRWQLPL